MASFVKTYIVERLAFCPPNPPGYDSVDDIVVAGSTHILHLNPGKCLSDSGRDVVVLYSHGNAEDLGKVEKMLKDFAGHWDVELVAYDYTGYGPNQTQKPSEEACYANMEEVLGYLATENIDSSQIVLMGRSLGSGPTCHAASLRQFAGVVLISPLLSAARTKIPMDLGKIDIFCNIDKVDRIHWPLLVIHGDQDRVVPYSHGTELYNAAPKAHTFVTVEDAGHNDLFYGPGRLSAFLLTVAKFMDSLGEATEATE